MEILGLIIGLGVLIILAFPRAQENLKTETALAQDDYSGAAKHGGCVALIGLVALIGFVALVLVPFAGDAKEVYPGSAPKEVVLLLVVLIAGGAAWGISIMRDARRLTDAKTKQLEAQGRDSSGMSCAYLLIMAALFALAGVGVVVAKTVPGFLP